VNNKKIIEINNYPWL